MQKEQLQKCNRDLAENKVQTKVFCKKSRMSCKSNDSATLKNVSTKN